MANRDITGHQQQFIEEINYNEIEREQVVGKGSFGVVWKGKWRGQYVAVKHINSEGERKAFTVEVRQLSRVFHPNIVKLYGACTKNPVCLVMEYAEGGSLYNVLHCNPQPRYTASHAMSWALQCARGVAYLHNMKPKPLIHRDLKPPNLLLVMGGQTLKICDFGTACDLNTYMTNNKGSAAWMAPEVFEGSRYTEKCDVFSWGVILWEVLSRKKPFDEIGASAYRIMWAVHIGQRPPLIEGCPRPIEELMTRCWQKCPEDRPSMDEVVRIMTILFEFFNNNLEPVEYSLGSEADDIDGNEDTKDDILDMVTTLDTRINGSVINGTICPNVTPPIKQTNNLTDSEFNSYSVISQQSSNNALTHSSSQIKRSLPQCNPIIPQSTSSSVENANRNAKDVLYGTPAMKRGDRQFILPQSESSMTPLHVNCDTDAWELSNFSDSSWEIHNMAGLDKMVQKTKKTVRGTSTTSEDLDNVYRLLDADLRPLTPDHTCERSREIFEEHKQLAQEYLKVQTEIALLGQHKNEMLKNISIDNLRQQQELRKLEDEKESLVKLYRNLKRQLEIMKSKRTSNNPVNNCIPTISPAVSGNNGWVVVPRQDP
ncbi:PREDICTED: mitogen-activated protein kinase kinase kinase 7-like [Polistes dominula]|uniref:Mitogen-activated protein kinase kinase kinase 7-like n=1 Tax=Polistes dominula TaxID=743375 RepID=A0ABM1JGR7_POLDO|nr:PREDICTED: mitogen-activated protein kinase kinase kinase 7-like [Polistes dominula]